MSRSLGQSPDAAGAKHLANHESLLQYGNRLEIGAKSPAGCMLRETAVITKFRALATVIALCHCSNPFLRNNCCW